MGESVKKIHDTSSLMTQDDYKGPARERGPGMHFIQPTQDMITGGPRVNDVQVFRGPETIAAPLAVKLIKMFS